MGHMSPERLHSYICAARLAFADRFEYLADPNFVDVPWDGLVSREYAAERADLRALLEAETATDESIFTGGVDRALVEFGAPIIEAKPRRVDRARVHRSGRQRALAASGEHQGEPQ